MPIQFVPEALEHVVQSSYAETRLKNREGILKVGPEIIQSGKVCDLYATAVALLAQDPELVIQLMEHSCVSYVG